MLVLEGSPRDLPVGTSIPQIPGFCTPVSSWWMPRPPPLRRRLHRSSHVIRRHARLIIFSLETCQVYKLALGPSLRPPCLSSSTFWTINSMESPGVLLVDGTLPDEGQTKKRRFSASPKKCIAPEPSVDVAPRRGCLSCVCLYNSMWVLQKQAGRWNFSLRAVRRLASSNPCLGDQDHENLDANLSQGYKSIVHRLPSLLLACLHKITRKSSSVVVPSEVL
jgi:hypothetical protein